MSASYLIPGANSRISGAALFIAERLWTVSVFLAFPFVALTPIVSRFCASTVSNLPDVKEKVRKALCLSLNSSDLEAKTQKHEAGTNCHGHDQVARHRLRFSALTALQVKEPRNAAR